MNTKDHETMSKPYDDLVTARKTTPSGFSRSALLGFIASCVGLVMTTSACDLEDAEKDEVSESEDSEKSTSTFRELEQHTTYKHGILDDYRPVFTSGVKASLDCGEHEDISHRISSASLRYLYYVAVNDRQGQDETLAPADKQALCEGRLVELYGVVGLQAPNALVEPCDSHLQDRILGNRDKRTILAQACDPQNLEIVLPTCFDKKILKDLHNAEQNLRCGHESSNRSISHNLDVPCEDQLSNEDGFFITGESAESILAAHELVMKANDHVIDVFNEEGQHWPLTIAVVDRDCCDCPSGPRLQSSDCDSDVGYNSTNREVMNLGDPSFPISCALPSEEGCMIPMDIDE